MRVRSRGLGRRELQLDLKEFTITREGNDLLLSGVTHAPVTWDTSIRVEPADVPRVLRLIVSRKSLALGMRYVFHMKPKVVDEGTAAAEAERFGARRGAAGGDGARRAATASGAGAGAGARAATAASRVPAGRAVGSVRAGAGSNANANGADGGAVAGGGEDMAGGGEDMAGDAADAAGDEELAGAAG